MKMCVDSRLIAVMVVAVVVRRLEMDMLSDAPIADVDVLYPPSLNGTWVCERQVASVEGDVGQARGASLTAIALEKIPILELSSNEIKKSIVGNGHATKTQMQFMVKSLLRLNTAVCQDASDALASAITLSHRLKLTHHDQQNPRNNC